MALSELRHMDGMSTSGLAQIEKDREKRIAILKRKWEQMSQGLQTDLLQKQPRAPKQKCVKRRAPAHATQERELRRSSRISNQPVPLYYIDEDPTESASKRRCSTTPSRGPNGRRCHGTAAVVKAGNDPFLWAPQGWKIECGSASMAAADKAIAAAAGLVQALGAQGTNAFVKLMSASQVSGGFWCQLPIDILRYYGTEITVDKRVIILHCDDKKDQDPDSFQCSLPGSSTKWAAVYLPKSDGGGIGLSGGWRAFAIDMRIHPNDTVVFEVMDNYDSAAALTPAEAEAVAYAACNSVKKPASTAAEAAWVAAAEAAKSQAAVNAEVSGSTAAVDSSDDDVQQEDQNKTAAADDRVVAECRQKLHMRVHIFRAADYETDETRDGAQPKQQLTALSTPQAAAPASNLAGSGSQGLDHDQQQRQCSSDGDVADVLLDVPLAKCGKLAAIDQHADTAVRLDQQGSLNMPQLSDEDSSKPCTTTQSSEQPGHQGNTQQQQQQHQQQQGLMAAAEAGELPVRVARQVSGSKVTKRYSTDKADGPSKAATKHQADKPSDALPRKKRAAAAAASLAWATEAKKSRKSSAGGADSSIELVPQPANPAVLVPPPTEDEHKRNAAATSFEVERIMAHRCKNKRDEFLIRWRGFGPWWDQWEPKSSLLEAPGSYDWEGGKAATPAKFRL